MEPTERTNQARSYRASPPRVKETLWTHTSSSSLLRAAFVPALGDGGGKAGAFRSLEAFAQIACTGKNLLEPIRAYGSLVQDDNSGSDNTRRWVAKIMRNVESLERYLDGLSMLGVTGSAARAAVTWNAVIARALSHCRPVNCGATIEVNNESKAPFRQKDELLVRALFQVVKNACEAAGEEGRVWLFVDEDRADAEQGIMRRFKVAVSDTGDGIESKDVEHIWKPFYTTRHDHLGLGLAYVAAAAPIIGMDVEVESTVGRGTTVTMTLREQGGPK